MHCTAFKNPSALTRTTRACLVAGALTSIAAIAASLQEYALLRRAQGGQLTLDEVYEQTLLATALVSLPQLLVALASYVIIGMWIYRIAWNARGFAGARNMDFTPGWSVGWYFVPLLNLWKPYQAMKEIWRASASPSNKDTAPVTWLLPLWWTLWLLANGAGNIAGQLAWKASTIEDEMGAALVMVASDAINIPLCLVFLPIVNRVAEMQQRQRLLRNDVVAG